MGNCIEHWLYIALGRLNDLWLRQPLRCSFQITVLAIIVTVIKIILFDTKNYPELFGRPVTTTEAPVTTTSSLSSLWTPNQRGTPTRSSSPHTQQRKAVFKIQKDLSNDCFSCEATYNHVFLRINFILQVNSLSTGANANGFTEEKYIPIWWYKFTVTTTTFQFFVSFVEDD